MLQLQGTLQKEEKLENTKYIGYEIKVLDNLIARKIICESKLKEKKLLNPIQGKILQYLFENFNKDVYQNDIEKQFNFRRSTISGILQTMEKNKLIIRTNSTKDARSKKIELTNESLDIGKEIKKIIARFDKTLRNEISPEELDIFFKVINKIKNNITN